MIFMVCLLTFFIASAHQGEKNEAKAGEDEKAASPPATELALNVGVQFGLTDARSDTALKFQGSIGF